MVIPCTRSATRAGKPYGLPLREDACTAFIRAHLTTMDSMAKCLGPHHDCDCDDFTTYDLTTFTTSRLVIDLETHFCTVNPVSRSITSRAVVKVVRS